MNDQTLRYSKQLILQGFGAETQERLRGGRVLVVGAGGLGSPVLMYLAAAGVGTLGIADFDTVTLSNLNRQIIHFESDVGRKKLDSAEDKIRQLNPEVRVVRHPVRVNIDNVEEIIAGYDVVIDCCDNFPVRYLLSDACFFAGIPIVEGAATGYDGILMTVIPGKGPCYRCLYPQPPADGVLPTCNDVGILGMLTGMVGAAQAMEAVKVLGGFGETLTGRILTLDAWSSGFREVPWSRRDNCPLCGSHPLIHELVAYEIQCRIKSF